MEPSPWAPFVLFSRLLLSVVGAPRLCRPTWIALGHSVDVGSSEDANTCPSPILHAHAQAQAQGRHRTHQEHHAKNDARDGSPPGKHTHKHTHCEPPGQVWWVAAVHVSFHTETAGIDVTQLGDGWVCVRKCVVCSARSGAWTGLI